MDRNKESNLWNVCRSRPDRNVEDSRARNSCYDCDRGISARSSPFGEGRAKSRDHRLPLLDESCLFVALSPVTSPSLVLLSLPLCFFSLGIPTSRISRYSRSASLSFRSSSSRTIRPLRFWIVHARTRIPVAWLLQCRSQSPPMRDISSSIVTASNR